MSLTGDDKTGIAELMSQEVETACSAPSAIFPPVEARLRAEGIISHEVGSSPITERRF